MIDVTKLKGHLFRGWALGDELGRGGSAIVYEATRGTETAAIKIFLPEALEEFGKEEQLQRLELQLTLKGKKPHPNLIEIIDGGVADEFEDTLYLIMERAN